ncbi:sensor histidine kinase [Pseudoponticoccus marisrubri]|nr:HWE histidine kinase domain-containing protein [Pseudoponticoccus marisrubri]
MELPERTRLGEDQLRVGLEVASIGIGSVNYRDDTVFLDDLAAKLFDLPAGMEIMRDALHQRIHPEDWPEVELRVTCLLDPGDVDVLNLTHRVVLPDGETRWVRTRKQITFETPADGGRRRPVSGVFAVYDVTEEHRSQEQIQLLLGEMNHRTKNVYSVVTGIARQMKRQVDDNGFVDAFVERVNALARNQDTVAQERTARADIRDVITAQVQPFIGKDPGRVMMKGPRQPLTADTAQAIALSMHEMMTNAVKYGALSQEGGRVTVQWSREGDARERFVLDWQEHDGPAVTPPEREGFGTKLLDMFTRSALGGEVALSYPPEGFHARISAPADRL